MPAKQASPQSDEDLHCPTCRATLKRRRARKADACEMVCGGCGEIFDVCDADTVTELKKGDA